PIGLAAPIHPSSFILHPWNRGNQHMRKTLAICLLAVMAFAGQAFAGAEGRISGKVIDAATQKPIPNATIHLSATEAHKFEQDYKSDKDGTYKIFLIDATI